MNEKNALSGNLEIGSLGSWDPSFLGNTWITSKLLLWTIMNEYNLEDKSISQYC